MITLNVISRIALLVALVSLLSGCSFFSGNNTKQGLTANVESIKLSVPAAQQRVIIYNHGTHLSFEREACFLPINQAPESLVQLSLDSPQKRLLVYRLCSTAIEDTHEPADAGKQVYLRKQEINTVIDAFLAKGILPKHLFLAGHSNGGWTSLMMMRDVNKRFNGVIAFAPAFAGRRDEENAFPWWRRQARPAQIKDMLGAPEMDALVFAYDNDAYNRPQDLTFLTDKYPRKDKHGVELVSYGCSSFYPAHVTFWKDCHLDRTKKQINQFITEQILHW